MYIIDWLNGFISGFASYFSYGINVVLVLKKYINSFLTVFCVLHLKTMNLSGKLVYL